MQVHSGLTLARAPSRCYIGGCMAKTKPAPFKQKQVRSSNSNLRFDPFHGSVSRETDTLGRITTGSPAQPWGRAWSVSRPRDGLNVGLPQNAPCFNTEVLDNQRNRKVNQPQLEPLGPSIGKNAPCLWIDLFPFPRLDLGPLARDDHTSGVILTQTVPFPSPSPAPVQAGICYAATRFTLEAVCTFRIARVRACACS